jgi:ribosomal protein S30
LYFSTSKAGKVRDIVAHVHVGQRLQIAPRGAVSVLVLLY